MSRSRTARTSSVAKPAYLDGDGRWVELGVRLGRGGEGEVFEVAGEPARAAKILHAQGAPGKAEKIQQMVERPPTGAYGTIEGFPVLTWPRGILREARGRGTRTAGYTMTRVHPHEFVPFFRLTTTARRREFGGRALTWDRMLLLATRLCHVVRTLHRFGYAVGDLNDRNVLVSRRLTPLLMDTDSFEVPRPGGGHFPSVVGDPLYWPPELLDVNLARHKESRETGDRFALGVLLFQLFMDGLRPYQSRGSAVDAMDTLAKKTKAGHYAWASPQDGVLEPPAGAPSYDALPRPIRHAFERCFVKGHTRPDKRPTADEWHTTLTRLIADGFRPCARNAGHVYGSKDSSCPWCADPNDRFSQRKPARLPPPIRRVAIESPVSVRPIRSAASRRTLRSKRPTSKSKRASNAKPGRKAPSSRTVSRRRPLVSATPTVQLHVKRKAPPLPLSKRLSIRALWLTALVLALASPAAALAQVPDTPEKKLVTTATSLALVGGAGVAAALHWLAKPRSRTIASWLWLTAAVCATVAVGTMGQWTWISWAAGALCAAAGLAVFVVLERRDATPFRPDRSGWIHTAAALPVAYLPLVVVWALQWWLSK